MSVDTKNVQELLDQFEAIAPVVKEIVENRESNEVVIKDLTQGIVDLREDFKAFSTNGNEQVKQVGNRWLWVDKESAQKFTDFLVGVVTQDETKIKAAAGQNETVDADGGYLVPPEYSTTVLRLIDVYGKIWSRVTVIPMARLEMKITTLASGVTVYWVDEAAVITESKAQFGQFTMTAKKLCALVPYTAELASDAFLSIASYIATLVAEAYAKEIDRVAFRGDISGASDPFDGLFVDSSITRHTMSTGNTKFSDVDADELLDMTADISEAAKIGAEYWMHPTVFDACRKLKDSNGNYIVQHPTEKGPATMWGYPVYTHDLLPSIADEDDSTIGVGPFILFGNLKHFIIGDREDLSVARSDELYFTTDQVAWRWKRRLSMKVALPEAFVLLVPSST